MQILIYLFSTQALAALEMEIDYFKILLQLSFQAHSLTA